jgi:hypothetical protein
MNRLCVREGFAIQRVKLQMGGKVAGAGVYPPGVGWGVCGVCWSRGMHWTRRGQSQHALPGPPSATMHTSARRTPRRVSRERLWKLVRDWCMLWLGM